MLCEAEELEARAVDVHEELDGLVLRVLLLRQLSVVDGHQVEDELNEEAAEAEVVPRKRVERAVERSELLDNASVRDARRLPERQPRAVRLQQSVVVRQNEVVRERALLPLLRVTRRKLLRGDERERAKQPDERAEVRVHDRREEVRVEPR